MIFVSYSHRDEALKDRVISHLQALTDSAGVSVWDDRKIRTGQEWLAEIESALAKSRAAVLLISVEFLNSVFIKECEIPRLLANREREGLRVFPVLARPCNWKMYDWLQRLQLWPRDGVPLSGMDEHTREQSLATLVEEIARESTATAQTVSQQRPAVSPDEKEQLLMSEINKELLATSAQLGAASCSLTLVDPDSGGKYLIIKSAFGRGSEKIAGLRILSDRGIAGLVFTRNIPHRTNDLPGETAFAPSVARKADLPPQSMITVPIRLADDPLGVAQFINKEKGPFLDDDTALALQFAERVAPLVKQTLQQPVEDRGFEGVRECSIIFTDITKYGLVADSSELPITSKFLNEYLTLVCNVAIDFGFWIDKFLGDGVMLVGNAPRRRSEYALDSLRLAREVETRMMRLIADWVRFGLKAPISELRSRIGIATGRVYLGNIGHPKFRWYTAIGPTVNLAWRLLDLGARDEDCIMICPRTFELTRDQIQADRLTLNYKDASAEPGIAYRVRELLAS